MYLNWHWIVLAIPFWIRMNFASTACDLRWKNCDGKKGRRDRYRTARIKNEPNIWLEWQQNRRTSQTVLVWAFLLFSCFCRVKVDIMPFHFVLVFGIQMKKIKSTSSMETWFFLYLLSQTHTPWISKAQACMRQCEWHALSQTPPSPTTMVRWVIANTK